MPTCVHGCRAYLLVSPGSGDSGPCDCDTWGFVPNLGPRSPDSPRLPPEAETASPAPIPPGLLMRPWLPRVAFRPSDSPGPTSAPWHCGGSGFPRHQEGMATSGSTWVPGIALSREALAGCSARAWGENILGRKPWGLFIPIPAQRFFCRPGDPWVGEGNGSILCLPALG